MIVELALIQRKYLDAPAETVTFISLQFLVRHGYAFVIPATPQDSGDHPDALLKVTKP